MVVFLSVSQIQDGPNGERLEAAMNTLGISTLEPVCHKMASIQFKFGPAEFSCLKIGQISYSDGVRMFVTRADRPALSR